VVVYQSVAVAVTVQNWLRFYFADLHSHPAYSDGTLTPAIAHEYARDEAKLDVLCLTDHLESVDEIEWLDMREQAWDFNENGKFVAIPSLEYSEAGDQAIQLMEVRRENEEKAFIRALDKGWHLAPDGSDDTHAPNWGNAGRWTGILAPGLSKRCIWEALKNRRVYSTLDRNCWLRFRVNGAEMGSIVDEPVSNVEVYVRVSDPESDDAISKIELFEDGKVVATDTPNRNARCWPVSRKPERGRHYYFVKVTQADGNMLWSAPAWVTVSGT
jgi:hypothetical protein